MMRTARADAQPQARVLLAAGNQRVRRLAIAHLRSAEYAVETAGSVRAGLDACIRSRPHLVIVDIDCPAIDGFTLMRELKQRWPDIVVIVLTECEGLERANRAMTRGAFSYLVKPVDAEELLGHVRRAIQTSSLPRPGDDWHSRLAARAALLDHRVALIKQAAQSEASLLLSGPGSPGKELMARAIHAASSRREEPFIAISCKGAVQSWLQWELFHREGSSSAAKRGTLFIDEIGELPCGLQRQFLDSLGGPRLICTTSTDLPSMVSAGLFRAELFERISTMTMDIPPLGRRREDLPLLVSNFLSTVYSPANIRQLVTRYWPEEVMHLFNLIKINVAMNRGRPSKRTRAGFYRLLERCRAQSLGLHADSEV